VSKARNHARGGPGASFVTRLAAADEPKARRVADALVESLDPADAAAGAFEQPDGRWQVEVHFRTRPKLEALRTLVAQAGGARLASKLQVQRVAPRDWVAEGLIGLAPVRAGRFVVHGAHDRDRVPPHCVAIEIEAGQAFGTGHHGTTRGCLLALDALARHCRPRHILDLGTGSGVLAIAAAKTFQVPVLATDIDPVSVRVARANARLNGVGSLVTALQANGLRAPEVVRGAPFDLVLANILLRPLQRLAAPMARNLMPNARVVLSGVLAAQATALLAAYRSQALMLERSFKLDGWVTPVVTALSV
jgi:ribosomal protein L11 methyltransferase